MSDTIRIPGIIRVIRNPIDRAVGALKIAPALTAEEWGRLVEFLATLVAVINDSFLEKKHFESFSVGLSRQRFFCERDSFSSMVSW